jgi:hypothetical protein
MAAEDSEAASAARVVLADITGPPLARSLADFWSPTLSQARLRALAAPPATTIVPDLLLRMTDPPRSRSAARTSGTSLAPAYEQLAADDIPSAE